VAAAKREKKTKNASVSSMHTTKLEQSISLDIHGHKTVITIQMSN
jgi:hypothetical protein